MPRLLAVLLLTLLGLPRVGEAAPFAEEYSIKAAYLFKFTKFVEWPREAFQSDPGHHVFCVYRADPFGEVLDRTLAGKQVEGRTAVVRRVKNLEELPRCQVVFLAAAEAAGLPKVLTALGETPVLLVGESPGFATRGGMVNFVLRERNVRFEINPRAAAQARLKLDAQLLDLAEIVGAGRLE
ncbi:MAG TPA: DUF4154 domain-containing protein [Acidobacteria bacterium]|nr:DUF4154 domain-containing protein [Acidobacteriota bacterium]